ncbi:MAG: flagellar hook-associated protein FlgK [Hylemonella sp.]|nr:flagellar hook-associated protein FlgK [Hylemonella sp.]MDH5707626.1 flagellar hook-associated protein FlgK [Hylemonella sp.]
MGSSIMNIGVRALAANQGALQTISHNIANVNTPGYSRQSAVLQDVEGQYSGSGYFGKGVEILTVERIYSEFLTRQSAASKSVAAADTARFDTLRRLEEIFPGGPDALGASVSNMLNAFSDIVSAPTDLTARSVVLARADEMAANFRAAAGQLNDLKLGITSQLENSVAAVNSLAGQIAKANEEIARAMGGGHEPNDLLDQRDELISQLNRYVRTSTIAADDGSVGIFVASSHPLVLGTTVSPLSIVKDDFNDSAKSQLAITVAGNTHVINESLLGGGEIAGLLRVQNTDLVDAANLLGRMGLAIATRMNEQQMLGVDLNGNPGAPLFSFNAMPDGLPADTNTGNATLSLAIQSSPTSGTDAFVASDYQLAFSSGSTGTLTRLSDGSSTAFDFGITNPLQIDGVEISISAGAAAAGDRFVLKPFSAVASDLSTAFSSPRGLAMASPIAATAGTTNTGTLALEQLDTLSVPPPPAVTLNFTGPGSYTRSDTGATVYTYTPGQPILYSPALPPNGWSLTLKGTAQAGDSFVVDANPYPMINADNARTMLDLRDALLFDGGPLTDGYASLMAELGIRVQSAESAATVSRHIADNIEQDRSSISGVNLDEEAARMLQYQQAYQASGKMLQVAQNIFDSLLQSLGR